VNGLVKAFDNSKRLCAHLWRDTKMKHLLRVLFGLVLVCGVASHARAQDFHAGLADPNTCGPVNTSACTIVDAMGSITGFQFSNAACTAPEVPAAPPTPYCIDLFNETAFNITSVTLSIPNSALGGLTPVCDTTMAFTGSCSMSGGTDIFSFLGNFKPGTVVDLYIFATDTPNFDPTVIDENATITVATPEPDSLLLLFTGVMMAGLYLAKRRIHFAFGKK
jgi:hypothetical protein